MLESLRMRWHDEKFYSGKELILGKDITFSKLIILEII